MILQNDYHTTPDIPEHLKRCLNRQAPKGDTADEMVVNQIKTADEQRACSKAVLEWYKGVQEANKRAKK